MYPLEGACVSSSPRSTHFHSIYLLNYMPMDIWIYDFDLEAQVISLSLRKPKYVPRCFSQYQLKQNFTLLLNPVALWPRESTAFKCQGLFISKTSDFDVLTLPFLSYPSICYTYYIRMILFQEIDIILKFLFHLKQILLDTIYIKPTIAKNLHMVKVVLD